MLPEAPDEPLTDFLKDYADIVSEPLYIQQEYNGIPYYNGTICVSGQSTPSTHSKTYT